MLMRAPAGHLGISIIEMMVAVAVLALLLTFSAPAFTQWIMNIQIRTATEGAQSGLQLARAEAVRRNTRVEFVLAPGLGGGWTVRTAAPVEAIQSRPGGEGSGSVAFTVSPPGTGAVTFDGLGRTLAANLDGSPRIEQIDVAGIAGGDRNLRVLVGLGGQIRTCDPKVSDVSDPRRC